MERLTEYDEFGNAEFVGIDNTKLYERLVCDETVALTIATNKLAKLEDVLEKYNIENLEEATTHYDALVEENNTFLMENSKMAGELKDLRKQLAITEKALELACERVKYFEEMQDKEMGHFEFFGYDNEYGLQAIIEQYKQQAKEMLENEKRR